jgi:hypothetical protein
MIKTAALLYMAANNSYRLHLFILEHGKNMTVVSNANIVGQIITPIPFSKAKGGNLSDTIISQQEEQLKLQNGKMMTTFSKWLQYFSQYKPCGKVLPIFHDFPCAHGEKVASINDVEEFIYMSNASFRLF